MAPESVPFPSVKPSPNPGDEVVISGLSGRFPECNNIEELKQQLFDGVDMITDDDRRWTPGLHGMPKRNGKLKNLEAFDATFFGINALQAHSMDPLHRILLEITYEAIIDAGYNPVELRGTRTGVFIGASSVESSDHFFQDSDRVHGYAMIGATFAMMSNRLSYNFDFTGPSYTVDTACSSSMFAFHHAFKAMQSGDCDAAIVAGANIILKPNFSLAIHRLGMLSLEGACKSFDESGSGYVRSEAVSAIFLQKAKDARRIYATVLNVRTNTDGSKEQGVVAPSGKMHYQLMREVYTEAGINPLDVTYVEAHGTGTKQGDPQEVNAIADAFCENREGPLLIGSVKSNIGHSEPASGVCSVAKVVIAMESGVIPANLHYKTPNPDCPGLLDGRLQVVVKNTPWNGGLTGINSFGFGGANAHVLLRSNPKPKTIATESSAVPRMVAVSGRTNEAVENLLNKVEEHQKDPELVALLHHIHAENIKGHAFRGYSIMDEEKTREIDQFGGGEKRPIWYVFSGMGSQWPGMIRDMMQIDVFKNAIQRSCNALKPLGLDLENILTNATDETYDNVLYSFVSIAAVQVALVDTLTSLGIKPDGILGHSAGEVGCGYADGSLTAEEAVKVAYFRGKSLLDCRFPVGAMAAVGLSWEECKKRCPPDVTPACNNAADSVSISGPPESIEKFVAELNKEDIFARTVHSSGVAFHSKYISEAGPKLQKYLEELIPYPKPRSSKWISTSIPEEAWNIPLAQLNSAAYHVNNFLSPVLFAEAMKHVPSNAIVLEIAPHCLLQAILKRSLNSESTCIGLMKKLHKNNLQCFMSSVGKLFITGGQPQLQHFYPPVSFPVSRGTPMLAPWVEWDHSTEWEVADYSGKNKHSGEVTVSIDLRKPDDASLAGHIIDGRVLFPATGYLVIVWKSYAKIRNMNYDDLPIVFEGVKFERAVIIPKDTTVKFLVNFFDGSGEFEISEGGEVVASGRIRDPDDPDRELLDLPPPDITSSSEFLTLKTSDVYKDMRLKGYEYEGLFRGIVEIENNAQVGKLRWQKDYIGYIDTMLQFLTLAINQRELFIPTKFQRVIINPKKHAEMVAAVQDEEVTLPMYVYRDIRIIKSGGIEIRGIGATLASRRPQVQIPKLERYEFVPLENDKPLNSDEAKAKEMALTALLQTINENLGDVPNLNGAEISNGQVAENLLASSVLEIMQSQPMYRPNIDFTVYTDTPQEGYATVLEPIEVKMAVKDLWAGPVDTNLHFIVGSNVISTTSVGILVNMVDAVKPGGFILLQESSDNVAGASLPQEVNAELIGKQVTESNTFILLRRPSEEKSEEKIVINITEENYQWVEPLKEAMKKSETTNAKVYVVGQGEEKLGLQGLVNCLKQEPGGLNVREVFIPDKNRQNFSLKSSKYKKQLKKDLVSNVFKNGVWGAYRHFLLDSTSLSNESAAVEYAYVNTINRGDLSSLRWIQGSPEIYRNNDPFKQVCQIYYASLNFRDVMIASGKIPPNLLAGGIGNKECVLGVEYSGRNSKGQRVMGLMDAEALATTVLTDTRLTWVIPDQWTLEEAATLPMAYGTAFYALLIRDKLKKGESILIHSGTGGVGQAAISLALTIGCIVFTTVGSDEKREYLKKRFPTLTDRHIGNSRDISFEQLVLTETNGRGVDVVLNSLAEDKLQASIRCLACDGRFLEIGKYDLGKDNPLGLSVLLKNTKIIGVLMDTLGSFKPDDPERDELIRLLYEGMKNGAVRPLDRTVFLEDQVEEAFRYMSTGKHIGKVLIKLREEESDKIFNPPRKLINAVPRTYMSADKSYILVGGLGGFGLEIAYWLTTRGAKKIILLSRNRVKDGYQSLCIRRWKEKGVNVQIFTHDVTNSEGAIALLKDAAKIGPVGGIFNFACVLRDGMLENLTESDFETSAIPKINATKALDKASRDLCPELDYFVVFSSVSCGRGNAGQTNYGYSNSAMERICELRQQVGFPATAIQWGAVGDVGLIMETVAGNDTVIKGTLPQRISSCLQSIDYLLQQPHPVLASIVLADKHNSSNDSSASLVDQVAKYLGIKDIKTVPHSALLTDLGMDSLMVTEIRQTLQRDYDLVLSPKEIRTLTFGKLVEISNSKKGDVAEKIREVKRLEDEIFDLLDYNENEIMPKESIVLMPSKNDQATRKTPVFLLHSMEGFVTALEELASHLPAPVYGLQFTNDAPTESIKALGSHYVEIILNNQPKGPYFLAGYSFGGAVAFEIALQLEALKHEVKLVLVDGSPAFISHNEEKKADDAIVNVRGSRALFFFIKCFNKSVDEIKTMQELLEIKSPEDKLQYVINAVKGLNKYPEKDTEDAVRAFAYKIKMSHGYKPSDKFNGEVTLVKSKTNPRQLSEDYGLGPICSKPVKIETLDGTHRSILKGDLAKKIADEISCLTG